MCFSARKEVRIGWCSATSIFDSVCSSLLNTEWDAPGGGIRTAPEDVPIMILKNLAIELEDQDWDCQRESDYWKHPIVQKVFKELHLEWFIN